MQVSAQVGTKSSSAAAMFPSVDWSARRIGRRGPRHACAGEAGRRSRAHLATTGGGGRAIRFIREARHASGGEIHVQTEAAGQRQRCSLRSLVKAMCVPLGDHAGEPSSQSPSVSCRGFGRLLLRRDDEEVRAQLVDIADAIQA